MSCLEPIEIGTDGPARAVFTTRRGGVSGPPFDGLNLGADRGDDPAAVRSNRAALCRDLGIEGRSVSMAHQVHGAGVHRVGARPTDSLFPDALVGWPEADVLVTQEPDTPLMVLGADCLPVILWRRDHPAVGVAHAGWRGLVGGVLEAAIGALGEPSRLGAAIGAGIGPCCYPVSAEVRERFATRFGDGVVAGEAVDLAGAARAALARCGVPASAIQVVAACTSCEGARFYSHRRDGAGSGRHAGVVWLAATDGPRR